VQSKPEGMPRLEDDLELFAWRLILGQLRHDTDALRTVNEASVGTLSGVAASLAFLLSHVVADMFGGDRAAAAAAFEEGIPVMAAAAAEAEEFLHAVLHVETSELAETDDDAVTYAGRMVVAAFDPAHAWAGFNAVLDDVDREGLLATVTLSLNGMVAQALTQKYGSRAAATRAAENELEILEGQ
jgi:hypothetical protein